MVLITILLVFALLPGTVTLTAPLRWFPVWCGLLSLCELWLLNQPLDGPSAAYAFFGCVIIGVLNGIFVVARVLKIAIDRDRNQ